MKPTTHCEKCTTQKQGNWIFCKDEGCECHSSPIGDSKEEFIKTMKARPLDVPILWEEIADWWLPKLAEAEKEGMRKIVEELDALSFRGKNNLDFIEGQAMAMQTIISFKQSLKDKYKL